MMNLVESIDDWLIDKFEAPLKSYQKMPLHHLILHSMWFIPRNFIDKWHYRIFVRGKCAIKGCDEHCSSSIYLPEDVSEWYCKRCNAEGINQVVYTHEFFYSDAPLRNFIQALKGE